MAMQLARIPATHKIPKIGEPRSAGWDDFRIGPFPQSFELTVAPDDIKRWCHLYDDDTALYGDHAPHYILYYAGQSIVAPLRDISAGFARFRADFVAPVPSNRPLVISGEVISTYRRRGRGYAEWQVEARADGKLVQRAHLVFPVFGGAARRPRRTYPSTTSTRSRRSRAVRTARAEVDTGAHERIRRSR